MSAHLHVGISTCPNDTFAFQGLLSGAVAVEGCTLEIELADVEQLNARLLAGEFDLAKGSFAAALEAPDELGVLASGAALGHGVGPVLLASGNPAARPEDPGVRVLAPGRHTTATLLYRLFHPDGAEPEQVVFSEIVPALEDGRAQLGVCIHEARFTWRERGLALVEDLGETWERATGAALPLGGVLARKRLGEDLCRRFARALRSSIDHARAHPQEALATMRRHAQEESDEVLWKHVELYVSEQTRQLDAEGLRALRELASRASTLRKAAPAAPPAVLEVLGMERRPEAS